MKISALFGYASLRCIVGWSRPPALVGDNTGIERFEYAVVYYSGKRIKGRVWTENLYSSGVDYYYAVPFVAKEKSFVAGSKCMSTVPFVTLSMNVKRDILVEPWLLIWS